MRKIVYLFLSALVYPLALAFEYGCRIGERRARHATPRPPAVRPSGRHTAAYVRRHGYTLRVGSEPEAVT